MRYVLLGAGIVTNLIEMNPRIEKSYLNAIRSDVAAMGDVYIDGVFYRNGVLVKQFEGPYSAKYISALQAENAELSATVTEFSDALIELYEQTLEGGVTE